ncbi:MAG: hypothetical protein FD123_4190 [Bacteroidetes bacterium]|nr:MAG: hypothetical protein FD123_4190 [Bacteroidota bacterium]
MKEEIIRISFACGEKFENMPVQGEGRMCGKCSTLVVDFTKMQPEEIRNWLEARRGQKICGRYQTLHTNIPLKKKERHFLRFYNRLESARLWRPIRLSLLLLLTFTFLAAGCHPRKKIRHTQGVPVRFPD